MVSLLSIFLFGNLVSEHSDYWYLTHLCVLRRGLEVLLGWLLPFVRTDLTRVLGPLHEIWRASYKAAPGTGITGGGLELFIPHHTHHHGGDSLWWGTPSSRRGTFYLTPLRMGLGLCPVKIAGGNIELTMERECPKSVQPPPDFTLPVKAPARWHGLRSLVTLLLLKKIAFQILLCPFSIVFCWLRALTTETLSSHCLNFFLSPVIPCKTLLPFWLCSQGAHVAQRAGMAIILSLFQGIRQNLLVVNNLFVDIYFSFVQYFNNTAVVFCDFFSHKL